MNAVNPVVDSLIRQMLTALGVWLASKGYFDSNMVNDLVGAALILGSTFWSALHHSNAIAAAAATDATKPTTVEPGKI